LWIEPVLRLVACALLSLVVRSSGVLDTNGSFFAGVMGFLVWSTQGFQWVVVMITFVLTSTLATKYRYARKRKLWVAEEKGGTRQSRNVMANGLAPTIIAVLGKVYGVADLHLVFVGSVAAAMGDTLASELGVLSTSEPYLITTLQRVERGTDGGISLLGEAACLTGGFIIGVVGVLLGLPDPPRVMGVALLGAFAGCNLDSILGATLEQRGLVTNEIVNFLATLTGAYTATFFMV
jgi:uncharacterized protein (TIGR00297 family)